MKELIFIVFITFSLCEIHYLKKYGTLKTIDSNGLFYLNTETFNLGEIIHIQINVINGKMNDKIYYEFINIIPSKVIYPINSMTPTFESTAYSNIGKSTTIHNYFYDIKKNIN